MKCLPTIEVYGETAHSLYTTNDRGVNEVTPRATPRSILLREHAWPVYRGTTIDGKKTANRD